MRISSPSSAIAATIAARALTAPAVTSTSAGVIGLPNFRVYRSATAARIPGRPAFGVYFVVPAWAAAAAASMMWAGVLKLGSPTTRTMTSSIWRARSSTSRIPERGSAWARAERGFILPTPSATARATTRSRTWVNRRYSSASSGRERCGHPSTLAHEDGSCRELNVRIHDIQAIGLAGATPKGGWSEELRPEYTVHTLVIVRTDEGLTGTGSVFTNAGLVRAALAVMEPQYRGENALEPERVSEKLHQHTFWLGRGGGLTHTISGIDIALWGILGKTTAQPLGRLPGGRYRGRGRAYASILMDQPAPLSEQLRQIAARGFRAFKIGWGPFGRISQTLDEEIVRAARDAVGPDAQLMVDAGGSDAFWSNGLKWALRTADMLAAYDVDWFEEPLNPNALDDFVLLRRQAPLPIAGGGMMTRPQAFAPRVQAGGLGILPPDVTKVGGISEERRIGWMAQEHGARFIPHGWNTAVGLAADLQLAS